MGLANLKKKMSAKGSANVEKTAVKKSTKKAASKAKVEKKEKRQRAIGFEVPEENQAALTEMYEALEEKVASIGEDLNELLEGGKRAAVAPCRATMQEIIKMGKDFRKALQDTKANLVPIYKEDK